MTSYANHWKNEITPQLEAYRRAAATEKHNGIIEQIRVGGHVADGLRLVYAGQPELAREYFELTEIAAKLALSGERLDRLKQDPLWPRNRGEIQVALAVARGLSSGKTDAALFLQASSDFDEATSQVTRFTQIDREDLLWSIRCALIADDIERAKGLVKRRWQRIRQYEESELLKQIAARDLGVLPKLDEYFQLARVPQHHLVVSGSITHPLEIAVLRDKLVTPEKPPDWWAAAARVGA